MTGGDRKRNGEKQETSGVKLCYRCYGVLMSMLAVILCRFCSVLCFDSVLWFWSVLFFFRYGGGDGVDFFDYGFDVGIIHYPFRRGCFGWHFFDVFRSFRLYGVLLSAKGCTLVAGMQAPLEKRRFCLYIVHYFLRRKISFLCVLCKGYIRGGGALCILPSLFNLFYVTTLTLKYMRVMLKSVNYARRIFK